MASTCIQARVGCLDIEPTSIVHVSTLKARRWAQRDKDFLERLAMHKRPERELCPPSPYCNPIDDCDDVVEGPEDFLDLRWSRRQKYLRSYTFSRKEMTNDHTDKKKKKKKKTAKSSGLVNDGDDGRCSLLDSIFAMLFICVARGRAMAHFSDSSIVS